MPQFVYNGLSEEARARFREAAINAIMSRLSLKGTETPSDLAALKHAKAEMVENEALVIDQELDRRDEFMDLWGRPGHKNYPLALRFKKGQPVDVDEPPPVRKGARFIPDVNKRWAKIQTLVESGTLVEVGSEKEPAGPPVDLRKYKQAEAEALIEATADKDLLAKWADAEKRQGVGEAIEARIAQLGAA